MKNFLQSCVYSLNAMIYFREKHDNEEFRKILSVLLIPAGLMRYVLASIEAHLYKEPKNGCAVVLIVKNECRYIQEFIEYYLLLGCDVIVYDNDSDDATKEIIEKYKDVEYIPWVGKKRQIDAYNQACKKFKKKYRYILFFDADEFLIADDILQGRSLQSILDDAFNKKKNVACLGINWLIFGSSGLVEYPPSGVIDAFTHAAEDGFEWNQLVKSCVRPGKIVGWVNPHLPLQVAQYHKINLDGNEIFQPRNELPQNRSIRLYHYFVKNKKHFAEKVNKGMADRNAKRTMDEFYYYDKNDVVINKAVRIRNYLLSKKESLNHDC